MSRHGPLVLSVDLICEQRDSTENLPAVNARDVRVSKLLLNWMKYTDPSFQLRQRSRDDGGATLSCTVLPG